MENTVQLGVIGAMQRSHPALTRLWLQWTGVPGLERAAFDMVRPEEGTNPSTQIKLAAQSGVYQTWERLCDTLGMPQDAPERRSMPIHLRAKDKSHSSFWGAMKKRELEEVDGPIEWWWRLMVLRYRGVQKASKVLIREAIGDHGALDSGVIHFNNPTLIAPDKPDDPIINGQYIQPTHVTVSFRVKWDETVEGLAFDLNDTSFKGRFLSRLIDLATLRH